MMTKSELIKAEKSGFRGKLGAIYSPKKTLFRSWQPFAEKAFLKLYDADNKRVFKAEMKRNKSVFELEVKGDLSGKEYDFSVIQNGNKREFADSYSCLINKDGTRGIITDMEKNEPLGWENDKPVSIKDPIIYELSVRDFSMDESADFSNRGKFLAFCEENVKNSYGDACGLEYIKNLGVTHIQLMPVFDFDYNKREYNWGYDPRFFNAPCGYYAVDNAIIELRKLIMAVHNAGMGVIADVVYNHVYDEGKSVFERQIPGYFFRGENGFSNGSGCGNEFASERKMARKFILDSVTFLAREYHLDGFRFDLMGLLDIETMRLIRKKLKEINPDILIYGEGWTGGESALSENRRAVLKNADRLSGIAFFSDSFRDALRGNVFDVNDKGFLCGNMGRFEPIKKAVSGKRGVCEIPQTINYAECHDDHTLFDRLCIGLKTSDKRKIMLFEKTAAALLAVSKGILFLHAGQEFLRTKNHSSNSYDLPDSVNSIKWDMVSENRTLCEYYRGVLAFRKRFLNEFGGGTFSETNGCIIMKNEKFVMIINPTNKKLVIDRNNEYEIYADENSASDSLLYLKKGLSCGKHSVLIARCKTVEKRD